MKFVTYNLLLAFAVLFVGCAKDCVPEYSNDNIAYSVSVGDVLKSGTKSGGHSVESIEIFSDKTGSHKVYSLQYTDDRINSAFELMESGTRGVLYNSETDLRGLQFTANAYKADESALFEGITVRYADGKWSPATEKYWPKGQNLSFFANANMPEASVATLHTDKSGHVLTYIAIPSSASEQKDILLGCYKGNGEAGGAKNQASIHFDHPMTAVKFKFGKIGSFKKETDIIKSISISNVYSSGTCTAIYDASGEPSFAWTDRSGSTTVSMNNPSGLPIGTSGIIGEPFLLIPQNIVSQHVTITMVLTLDGVETTVVGSVDTGDWQNGKTTVYSLSFRNPTAFEIDEGKYVEFAPGYLYFNAIDNGGKGSWNFEENQLCGYSGDEYNDNEHYTNGKYHKTLFCYQNDYGWHPTYNVGNTVSSTIDWGSEAFRQYCETQGMLVNFGPGWRTLTLAEWIHLFTAQKFRWTEIDGNNGMCLYPKYYDGNYDETTLQEVVDNDVYFFMARGFIDASSLNNVIGENDYVRIQTSTKDGEKTAHLFYMQKSKSSSPGDNDIRTTIPNANGVITYYNTGGVIYGASSIRLVKEVVIE